MPTISIRDESLELLPEKMIWWQRRKTLIIADTHFGKAASFRKAGIPVPTGTTAAMLKRLSSVSDRFPVKRLLILGDFVHSKTGSNVDFEDELLQWRSRHKNLAIVLVRGNHDRGHAKLFQAMNIKVVAEPFNEAPFSFCHYHEANDDPTRYTLAGHVHPSVRVPELGKVACFQFSDRYGLLPAFGEFTGTCVVEPGTGDRIFIVADEQLVELETFASHTTGPPKRQLPIA